MQTFLLQKAIGGYTCCSCRWFLASSQQPMANLAILRQGCHACMALSVAFYFSFIPTEWLQLSSGYIVRGPLQISLSAIMIELENSRLQISRPSPLKFLNGHGRTILSQRRTGRRPSTVLRLPSWYFGSTMIAGGEFHLSSELAKDWRSLP